MQKVLITMKETAGHTFYDLYIRLRTFDLLAVVASR